MTSRDICLPEPLSTEREPLPFCEFCGAWMEFCGSYWKCQAGCKVCECGEALIDPKSPFDCCKKCTAIAVEEAA